MDDAKDEKPKMTGLDEIGEKQTQPKQLEQLPTEMLVLILASFESFPDLLSFICTSRLLHDVFKNHEVSVLFDVLAGSIGGALTELIASVEVAIPLKEATSSESAIAFNMPSSSESKRQILHYKYLLEQASGLTSAESRLFTKEAINTLIRTNRSVQYLVDQYAKLRLSKLQETHADARKPLTTLERQRLARALLRNQTLARVLDGHSTLFQGAESTFLVVWKPWEMHQVADMNSFVFDMVERAFPSIPWTKSEDRACRQRIRDANAAWLSLDRLRDALIAHQRREEAGIPIQTTSWMQDGGEFLMRSKFDIAVAGPLPRETWDNHVRPEIRPLRDRLYRREDALPCLKTEVSLDSPAFGWVDAHAGLDCQRWGNHLPREVMPAGQEDTTYEQRASLRSRLKRWRWIGFAFWDRDRVEILKSQMLEYQTGWLVRA